MYNITSLFFLIFRIFTNPKRSQPQLVRIIPELYCTILFAISLLHSTEFFFFFFTGNYRLIWLMYPCSFHNFNIGLLFFLCFFNKQDITEFLLEAQGVCVGVKWMKFWQGTCQKKTHFHVDRTNKCLMIITRNSVICSWVRVTSASHWY